MKLRSSDVGEYKYERQRVCERCNIFLLIYSQ